MRSWELFKLAEAAMLNQAKASLAWQPYRPLGSQLAWGEFMLGQHFELGVVAKLVQTTASSSLPSYRP